MLLLRYEVGSAAKRPEAKWSRLVVIRSVGRLDLRFRMKKKRSTQPVTQTLENLIPGDELNLA